MIRFWILPMMLSDRSAHTAWVSTRTDETSGGIVKCRRFLRLDILQNVVQRVPRGFFQSHLPHPHFLSIPSSPRLFSVSRIPNQFAILNSRISPSFCFKILDPGLQIRQIPNDKKPLWGALCSWLVNNAANSSHNSLKTLLVLTQTHLYDLLMSILNSWIFKNLSVLFQ